MKLRIRDNSIRLRLSQSEVTDFDSFGKVASKIHFGAGGALTYLIEKSKSEQIEAAFLGDTIKLTVPTQMATDWAASDQISLETKIPVANGNSLKVLIEKDFKCLAVRPDEDETDMFPHPKEGQLDC